jgi:hypothetical protein
MNALLCEYPEDFQEYIKKELEAGSNEGEQLKRDFEQLHIKYNKQVLENKMLIRLLKQTLETNQKLFNHMKRISIEVDIAQSLQNTSNSNIFPPKLERQTNDCSIFLSDVNMMEMETSSKTPLLEPINSPVNIDMSDYLQEKDSDYERYAKWI